MPLAQPDEPKTWLPPLPNGNPAGDRQALLGLAFLVLLGAALRLWWLSAVDTQPATDFHWYFERAKSIAQGAGYVVDGRATAYWPVGYPAALGMMLWLFGQEVVVGKGLNFLLTLVCIPLTFWLGQRLFRSHLTGFLAGLIVAVHPSFLAYSGILASEPLFTALTLLGSLCILNARGMPRKIFWAGVVFGAACLVRPQAAVIPFLTLLCAWWRDDSAPRSFRWWPAAGLLLAGMALPLVPWLIRNAQVFGGFVFVSTNGGDNLLIGHHPGATGRYKNPDLCGLERPGTMGEKERDRAAAAAAMANIRSDPGASIRLVPAKLQAAFLTSSDSAYWAFQKEYGVLSIPGMGSDKGLFLWFRDRSADAQWLLLVLAAAGTFAGLAASRRKAPFPALPWAMIGLASLLAAVFFGNPRFVFWVLPFLALLAGHLPTATMQALGRLEPAKENSPPPQDATEG